MCPELKLPDSKSKDNSVDPLKPATVEVEPEIKHLLLKIYNTTKRCCGQTGQTQYATVLYNQKTGILTIASKFYANHLTLIKNDGLWKGLAYPLYEDIKFKEKILRLIPKNSVIQK